MNIDHGLIARIDALNETRLALKDKLDERDKYVQACWQMNDILRDVWPALRDELLNQQAAIEKARAAFDHLIESAYDSDGACYGTLSTSFVSDVAREALAALDEPASDDGWCRKCGDKLSHDDDGPDICRFCESEVQSGPSAQCAAPKAE